VNLAGPVRTWEGPNPCIGTTRAGMQCRNQEIDGLEYCLQHMPDDLLEEAEWLRGAWRCRVRDGCRQYAVTGTLPPMCMNHGANLGSVQRRQAAIRVIEQQVAERYAEILAAACLAAAQGRAASDHERTVSA